MSEMMSEMLDHQLNTAPTAPPPPPAENSTNNQQEGRDENGAADQLRFEVEEECVEVLEEALYDCLKENPMPLARNGRSGPILYPSSLEFAQGIGQSDTDVLTDRERYKLLDSQKLVVGKYVPDPKAAAIAAKLKEQSLSDYLPGKKIGGRGSPATPPEPALDSEGNLIVNTPKPPPGFSTTTAGGAAGSGGPWRSQRVSATAGGGGGSSRVDDDKDWEDIPEEGGQGQAKKVNTNTGENDDDVEGDAVPDPVAESGAEMVARIKREAKKPKSIVRYKLVKPLFQTPLVSGTLFFPIYYPNKITTKEKNDPRGIAREINLRMHGEFSQPKHGYVVSQADNLHKMGLYKIGPGAVAFKIVINAFEAGGLKYTPRDDWNVMWAKRATPELLSLMNPYQRINHFIGAWGIGRKDNLHKNVRQMKQLHGKAFDIVPGTFVIPSERKELEKDFATWSQSSPTPGFIPTYICKPVASSCGKGIHLVQGLPPNPRAANKSLLVQRYIGNPLLIEGRKFDLRIYVAVTSFDPLRVYIFDEGLVRFAAEKYPGADSCLENTHMHLTNYSVNKTAQLAKDSKGKDITEEDDPVEIKWLLTEFRDHIINNCAKDKAAGLILWKNIEAQIHDIIIKSMLVVEMDVMAQMRAHSRDGTGRECFELYGFDLMVDDAFKCWLLEVNIMPSLATGFSIDKAVKGRLLAHLLTMIGLVPFDRRRVKLEDGGETALERQEQARSHLREEARKKNSNLAFTAASGAKCDVRYHYTPPKGSTGKSTSKNMAAVAADFVNEPLLESLSNEDTKIERPEISPDEIAMLIESDQELHRSGGWNRIFPVPCNGKATMDKYFHLFRCGVLRKNYLLASWEEIKGQMYAEAAAQAEEEEKKNKKEADDLPSQ